jgi:hypothetical protein
MRPVLLASAALLVALAARVPAQAPAAASGLDFATFRDRVQPVFLEKRAGFARCYVCHSQGTPFRIERLGEGQKTYTDEQSRKNFEAVQRLVVPGKPEASRLLLMPLAHEAGGTEFHPGGKHWESPDDPGFKNLAAWVSKTR